MSKEVQMTFRVDAELRSSFSQATELEHRPAAQVLRELMRAYVSKSRGRGPANDETSAAKERRHEIGQVAQVDKNMQEIIDSRVCSIIEAHANNLIEGLDAGEDYINALIDRARAPISTHEFERRELALLDAQYKKRSNVHD